MGVSSFISVLKRREFPVFFRELTLASLGYLLSVINKNLDSTLNLKELRGERSHGNEGHQEITLVYICRIRMRLYVIKSLNDIYMSNNF